MSNNYNERRHLRISLGSNVPKLRLWHLVPIHSPAKSSLLNMSKGVLSWCFSMFFSCNQCLQPTHSWLSLMLQAFRMFNAFMFAQTFLNLKVSVLSSKHGALSVNSLCNYIPKIATRIKRQGMPFCRIGYDSSDMLFKTHRTVMIMLQNPNAACCL